MLAPLAMSVYQGDQLDTPISQQPMPQSHASLSDYDVHVLERPSLFCRHSYVFTRPLVLTLRLLKFMPI